MDRVGQLREAVGIALQAGADPSLKQQALEFCGQVQSEPSAWWRPAMALAFPHSSHTTGSEGGDVPQELRFFGIQVIRAAVLTLSIESELEAVRSELWVNVVASYGIDTGYTPGPEDVAVRSKIAETLVSLFTRLYPTIWSSFFHDIKQAIHVDLWLRVLRDVHEEIGDVLIERSAGDLQRNVVLKDAVREHDMQFLIECFIDLLGSPSEYTAPSLEVLGYWISWIDLPLLLRCRNGIALPRILGHFHPNDPARYAAANTLNDILAKKMGPELKLELARHLNLAPILSTFDSNGDAEFEERAAALASTLAVELVRAGSRRDAADLLPTLLVFLESEYDDTAVLVAPALSEYVLSLRRDVRQLAGLNSTTPSDNPLQNEEREVLTVLLQKTAARSTDDPDSSDSDDSGTEFADLRARMRSVQEQIASVNLPLFVTVISEIIRNRLSGAKGWQDTELALFELDILGDVAKTTKDTATTTELVELVRTVIRVLPDGLGTASLQRTSVQLGILELIYRHAQAVFTSDAASNELLAHALEFFLGHNGVHNPALRVRVRSWNLLFRLVKATRKTELVASGRAAGTVFSSVAPLLSEIESTASITSEEESDNSIDTVFASLLYLYELVGLLSASQAPSERAALMQQLLSTLFASIEEATSTAVASSLDNEETVKVARRRVHHGLLALAALILGLGDALTDRSLLKEESDNGSAELVTATQAVVSVVERLYGASEVREAARVALSRLVALLGVRVLPQIGLLLNILLSNALPRDIGDLLSFLGQLAHTFQMDNDVFEMFRALTLPLFSKVIGALEEAQQVGNQADAGTDAAQHRKELVYDYLQFLQNMINNRFGAALLPVLDTVVQSLLLYAASASAAGGVPNQKLSVVVVDRMVRLYLPTSSVPIEQFATGELVPLFGETLAQQLTELCWTLPLKPDFKLRDAQTRLVALEIGGLQKTLWDSAGENYHQWLAAYLAQVGVPPALIAELSERAATAAPKDFKRFFYDLLVQAVQAAS